MEKRNQIIFDLLAKQEPVIDQTFEYVGHLDFSKKQYKHVVFEKCVFNDRSFFSDLDNIIDFHFEDCEFNHFLGFETLKRISELTFKNCKFHNLDITNCELEYVYFYDCQFKKPFKIDNTNAQSLIFQTFEENVIGTVSIESEKIERVSFFSSKSTSFQRIHLWKFNELQIMANVEEIEIISEMFKSLEIFSSSEYKLKIGLLQLAFLKFSGGIEIQGVHINNLKLNDVHSTQGFLKLSECKIKHTRINNCFIDDMILNQVQFESPPDL